MFTIGQAGVFADGQQYGHEQVRVCLGNLLANMYRHHPRGGPGIHWPEVEPIIKSLDGDPPDDMGDELQAIEWLNKMCEEGCHFTIENGDLLLVAEEEEDYDY